MSANIARAEGALSRFEIVEAELNQFQTQAEAFANTVSEVEKEVENTGRDGQGIRRQRGSAYRA